MREVWNLCKIKDCLFLIGVLMSYFVIWIMWEIWIVRNKLVFLNIKLKVEEFLLRVIFMVWEW